MSELKPPLYNQTSANALLQEEIEMLKHEIARAVKSNREPGMITPEMADKLVCDWSLEFGIALTTAQLNALCDRIAATAPVPAHS